MTQKAASSLHSRGCTQGWEDRDEWGWAHCEESDVYVWLPGHQATGYPLRQQGVAQWPVLHVSI